MIRINLVRQSRKARRESSEGQKPVAIGVGGLVLAGLAVFFLVHNPLVAEIDEWKTKNGKLEGEIKSLKAKVAKLADVDKINKALKKRAESIEQLNNARATPANLLNELSRILTPNGIPTMSDRMKARVKKDRNRQWSEGWDPKHVWFDRISENNSKVTIRGGAQSKRDINELALRLQASEYFDQVRETSSSQATDKGSGVNYYKFTMTGKVKY